MCQDRNQVRHRARTVSLRSGARARRARGGCDSGVVDHQGSDFRGRLLGLLAQATPIAFCLRSTLISTTASSPLSTTDQDRAVTWRTLFTLNRVTQQVAKDLLLCYVLIPPELTVDERGSPSCLSRFAIQEITTRRWVPDRIKSS